MIAHVEPIDTLWGISILVSDPRCRPIAPVEGDTDDVLPWGVYTMRMARVNVYLPDDLAAEVKVAGLNVSSLTQEALRGALAARRVDTWLDDVTAMRPLHISHRAVASAVAAAKDELGGHG